MDSVFSKVEPKFTCKDMIISIIYNQTVINNIGDHIYCKTDTYKIIKKE